MAASSPLPKRTKDSEPPLPLPKKPHTQKAEDEDVFLPKKRPPPSIETQRDSTRRAASAGALRRHRRDALRPGEVTAPGRGLEFTYADGRNPIRTSLKPWLKPLFVAIYRGTISFLGGSPSKIDYTKRCTLVLTSLPEDLVIHMGVDKYSWHQNDHVMGRKPVPPVNIPIQTKLD